MSIRKTEIRNLTSPPPFTETTTVVKPPFFETGAEVVFPGCKGLYQQGKNGKLGVAGAVSLTFKVEVTYLTTVMVSPTNIRLKYKYEASTSLVVRVLEQLSGSSNPAGDQQQVEPPLDDKPLEKSAKVKLVRPKIKPAAKPNVKPTKQATKKPTVAAITKTPPKVLAISSTKTSVTSITTTSSTSVTELTDDRSRSSKRTEYQSGNNRSYSPQSRRDRGGNIASSNRSNRNDSGDHFRKHGRQGSGRRYRDDYQDRIRHSDRDREDRRYSGLGNRGNSSLAETSSSTFSTSSSLSIEPRTDRPPTSPPPLPLVSFDQDSTRGSRFDPLICE